MTELAAKLKISVYQLEELINELNLEDLHGIIDIVSKRIELVKSWHNFAQHPHLLGTKDLLMVNVADVYFSQRTRNILAALSINTLYEVKHLGEKKLYTTANCGKVVISEIKEQLKIRGHELVP